MAIRQEKTNRKGLAERPWVLLVEDEPTVSKIVGKLLDEAGYEHVSISDHSQIPAAILRWKPQCIILDSEPGSPGHKRSWADAAAIRRANPDLPVLMFTADPASIAEARTGTTARSKSAHYAGVIDKPLLVVEFLATLKHAVGEPHSRQPRDGKGLSAEAVSIFPDLSSSASSEWGVADFFSMAVHELRTPLTSIEGLAQRAQKFVATDSARVAEALAGIREQSKRMNRLVGDLLDSGRIGAGALSLEVVTFDLGVATAITIGLHELDDAPRIRFAPSLSPIRLQGDPDRLAQILGNLLDNAVKYSPPHSPIDVALTLEGSEAVIRVRDRGVGVPKDESDRIFAPFYRTSRTREISGTGLGLHISRRIAEQHGGRLWLESSDGTGSVFTLALPLTQEA
jgi:signal transduction histidine kinase